MVKCPAQGHKRRDRPGGIRTHILTTPELESDARHCSATTLQHFFAVCLLFTLILLLFTHSVL